MRGADVDVVAIMLAFAAGASIGFTQGRVFERWEFTRKGYRIDERGKLGER